MLVGLSGSIVVLVWKGEGLSRSGVEYCDMLMSCGSDISTLRTLCNHALVWGKLYGKIIFQPQSFAQNPEHRCTTIARVLTLDLGISSQISHGIPHSQLGNGNPTCRCLSLCTHCPQENFIECSCSVSWKFIVIFMGKSCPSIDSLLC